LHCYDAAVVLALLVISPLLGLDNFAVAASIGLSSPGWRTCLRTCATFGAYAIVAPLIGLFLGQSVAAAVGDIGRPLGGGVLCLVGLSRLLAASRTSNPGASVPTVYSTSKLMTIGLAVSIDTVAAGFGLGLYGVPIVIAVATVAAGTLAMSFLGFQLAASVALRLVGARTDAFGSVVMTAVGVALAAKLL
jgi:putative Mn2+ efflux pump MntP